MHKTIYGKSFQLECNNDFSIYGYSNYNKLSYGKKSIGSLVISGDDVKASSYNDVTAYGANSELQLSYMNYNTEIQNKAPEEWNLTFSEPKSINGIPLPKKVGKGAVVVQSSTDKNNWITEYTDSDIFNKENQNDFYIITDKAVRNGTYYRIYIAYEMRRKIGETEGWFGSPFGREDIFDSQRFVELYELYVCYESDPVTLWSIDTGAALSYDATTAKGFIIDKRKTNCKVTVQRNNETSYSATDLEIIDKVGSYKIVVNTNLGSTYNYSVSVSQGMETMSISPFVYEGDKNGKYDETNLINDNTSYGTRSLTSLKLAQPSGAQIKATKTNDNTDGYGVIGSEASLYLKIENPASIEKNGWTVQNDNWGKNEKETIGGATGAWVGTVNSGAMLIQKSTDNGISYVNVSERTMNDCYNSYKDRGCLIPIYTPDGKELNNGLYLKVYYAYKMYNSETKAENRYLEVYKFYLFNNDLGAVTIHNLSVTDKIIRNNIGEDKENEIEIYKKAETLLSGSATVTGFTIDNSLNPTVKYTVLKDGRLIDEPDDGQYKAQGKYNIKLISAAGEEESKTIYVCDNSHENLLKRYFSEGFISGKRIYDEKSTYPVYEGGKTNYYLSNVSEQCLPIKGTIKNITTGNTINIVEGRNKRTGELTEAGEYVAEFTTLSDSLPGDHIKFTFHFSIIAAGTAPGPVVNRSSLNEYGKSTMSDSYPMYYGLTYSSASKGDINIAFATKEQAIEYAYNYEKGTVEEQTDGSFRYRGSFRLAQKEIYNNKWDITDAMNYFAEQAVQELYFDISDTFTFRTLQNDVLTEENLRVLELSDSITIFADTEQKAQLCGKNILPVINDKSYIYANQKEIEFTEFKFVRDKYGYDSDSVTIKDCNGKEYDIKYDESVGVQLSEYDCPSGIITIIESTVYGDTTSYDAIYIAKDDNTATITLECYNNDIDEPTIISLNKESDKTIYCDAFKIASVVDELEQFSLVKVKTPSPKMSMYVSDQPITAAWSEPGDYTIYVVNRLGYSFSFTINISKSNYATISFEGEGTEDLDDMLLTKGTKNVTLPKLNDRPGYKFLGYDDKDDNNIT